MFDICVIGSLNMDFVINVDKIPSVGETILASDFKRIPGGKGANQAVAAARLGSRVVMLGCAGKDDNAGSLIENLNKDKIYTGGIKILEDVSTGIALITVDRAGNNTISVYPGANMKLTCSDVESFKEYIKDSKIVAAQFETPVDTTIKAFGIAKESNKITILNPAPAREVPSELIRLSDIIVPNETEAEAITGISTASHEYIKKAGMVLLDRGARYVVITLGDKGAAIIDKENFTIVDALRVEAVDTTAAGDSFIGAVARFLSDKDELNFEILCRAVKFANKVSAITVTRIGAQSSLPYLEEVYAKFGGE